VPPQPLSAKRLARLEPAAHRLQLAASARLAQFDHEILEILELENSDLQALAAALSRTGSTAVIYPKDGEIRTESLAAPYFRLLQRLDGTCRAGEAAAEQGMTPDDADDFLRFALAEGIVVMIE
jgi:hypothetical protein